MTIGANEVLTVRLTMVSEGANVAMCVGNFINAAGIALTKSEVETDFTLWGAAMANAVKSQVSNQAQFVGLTLYHQTSLGAEEYLEIPIAITGTNVGDRNAHGVSALVTRAVSGSKGVCKKYVPNLCETAITGGFLNSSGLSTALTWGFYWLDVINSATAAGIVGSWFAGSFNPDRTPNFLYLTGGLKVPNSPAYQRRRKPGVGV